MAERLTNNTLRGMLADTPRKGWYRHNRTKNRYEVVGSCIREHDLAVCTLYRFEGYLDVVFCRPSAEFVLKFTKEP